jgi:PP-loop superfamily ATP-utilizing enzyme
VIFKALGFQYVTLDLQGYRLGSLNESLGESLGAGNTKQILPILS